MNRTYWQKQTANKPLFPDLVWSRPEQKSSAGKLLIVGGNVHAFSAPAEAFGHAEKAGAGTVRVVLPDATKRIVGKIMEHVEYASSTPSGSFSKKALVEILEGGLWADGVLVAGDLGRNSETAVLLEHFAQKYAGQLTLTKDAVDYVTSQPHMVSSRPDTLLVLTFAQLQKLATALGFQHAVTYDMDLLRFVNVLHGLTETYPFFIVVKHIDQLHAAVQGEVVTTPVSSDEDIWRVRTAAHAAVWWMQNPSKALEAVATSFLEKV